MTATLPLATSRAGGQVGFLMGLPPFSDRHRRAVEALAGLAEVRRVRRGAALWRVGDEADTVMVVRSGVVLLRSELAEHTVTLDVCGRGAFLGIAGGVRDHEATVHEDASVLRIDRDDFERWLVHHPGVVPAVLAVAAHISQRMASRLALVSLHGARARLALLLLDLVEHFGVRDSRGVIVDLRLTHREMATLIGATRETVSVAIVELRNAGTIATESRRVIVVDPDALKRIAGV